MSSLSELIPLIDSDSEFEEHFSDNSSEYHSEEEQDEAGEQGEAQDQEQAEEVQEIEEDEAVQNERIVENLLRKLNARFHRTTDENDYNDDDDDNDNDDDNNADDDDVVMEGEANIVTPDEFSSNPLEGAETDTREMELEQVVEEPIEVVEEEREQTRDIPSPPPPTLERLHLLQKHARTDNRINLILDAIHARYHNADNNTDE